jgi:hypothetical protein
LSNRRHFFGEIDVGAKTGRKCALGIAEQENPDG